MPQANSTTSMPRVTSPRASLMVLPCSSEMAFAKSFARSSSKALNLNMMRARRNAGVVDHSPKAACAALMAASTSATVALFNCACISPVAGLNTWLYLVPVPLVCWPLI